MGGKSRLQREVFRIVVLPDVAGLSRIAARTEGAGSKPLSLALMRALTARPRLLSMASGPTKERLLGRIDERRDRQLGIAEWVSWADVKIGPT